MPIFKFKGYDSQDNIIKDKIKVTDEDELKIKLNEYGIKLISYKEIKEKRRSNFFAISSKVKRSEFYTFTTEFAIMLSGGLSINECLDSLRRQKFSTVLKNAIDDVYQDILKGELLSKAFSKHKKIFPDFFVSMVRVGEISASLPITLKRASEYYDNDLKIRKKASSALVYPVFLLIVVVVIFFLLMTIVVPEFKNMILQYGGEVPLITEIVLSISEFFVSYWKELILAIAVIVLILFIFFKTKKGKYVKEVILFHFPVIRLIKKHTLTTRFALSLSILLESGLEIIDALKEMNEVMKSEYFTKRFSFAIDEVNNGKSMSRAIENTGLFPDLLTLMIRTGEETSSLPISLSKVGKYYEEQLDSSVAKATKLLEPLIIVIMGVLVGGVILSVMLPIFELTTSPLDNI